MIQITFPDKAVRTYEKGTTPLQIASSISEGLARNIIAAKVNGQVREISFQIEADAELRLLTWDDTDGKSAFWHSSAHLMAEAIQYYYPDARFTIGPPVENGFYYDIDFGDTAFSQDDFPKIEEKMLELARQQNPFVMSAVSKAEALKHYTEKNNPYKIELIEALEDGTITFCTQGSFVDLCRGGHIPHTGLVKAAKLMNVAGAYWRGNEKNKMLTRVYGITFPKEKELKEYLNQLEEAKKRDHRKLGREMELFTFSEKVGLGLPLWLPKGTVLREQLERFLRKAQIKAGYQPVVSPHIGGKQLYVTSGHYEKYGKDSFQPIHTPDENEEFLLKPMNCPHHCEMYKARPRSYRELPVRFAEFGTVYRYEQSGEVHGLTRVRGFTQDDAHIFCRPDQVKEEFSKVIDLVKFVFDNLGFHEFTAQVSLRDPDNKEKYIGSDELWERAEREIQEAADERGLKTVVEYGEAAFYGPKLDFMVRDALGRRWQLGTIQVDYQLPIRFELEYTGEDNQKHRPVMIHRAPFGSLERFIGILIEQTAGNFPIWLAPEQYAILPVAPKFTEYARQVHSLLLDAELRGFVDEREEKIGKKIRDAEMRKVPYMLVVGEKEVEALSLAVRKKGEGDLGQMSAEAFISHIKEQLPN